MGTFTITSSQLSNNYEYKNESVIVNGVFNKNNTTGEFLNINGTAYRAVGDGQQGDYIGNFNGYIRNGEIRYSLSEMSRRDSNLVWDAIDEIEQYVLAEDNTEE